MFPRSSEISQKGSIVVETQLQEKAKVMVSNSQVLISLFRSSQFTEVKENVYFYPNKCKCFRLNWLIQLVLYNNTVKIITNDYTLLRLGIMSQNKIFKMTE